MNSFKSWENILDRIRKANYFTIILDCTPDISYTDQMNLVRRHIFIEDKEVEVRESILGFITEHGKTAYDIKKMTLDQRGEEELDF